MLNYFETTSQGRGGSLLRANGFVGGPKCPTAAPLGRVPYLDRRAQTCSSICCVALGL